MSSKTDYFENLLNDAIIRGNAAALAEIAAAAIGVGLVKSALSESSVLASGANEVTGSGYSRISAATFHAAFGTASSSGLVTNTTAISFGAFSSAPGTIYAVGWIDITTGKIWYYYNLASPITPSTGSVVRYAAGALSFQEA